MTSLPNGKSDPPLSGSSRALISFFITALVSLVVYLGSMGAIVSSTPTEYITAPAFGAGATIPVINELGDLVDPFQGSCRANWCIDGPPTSH